MNKLLFFLLASAFLVSSFAAYAQESQPPVDQSAASDAQSTDAGETPTDTGEFMVSVQEVAGTVEIQAGGKGDWAPAVVGMRFGEGTSVCTGFKSGVILQFGDASVVMLKDLAQVTIDRLFKDANAVEGKLSLTVGRVGVFVQKQEIRTEVRVSTPRLTAAVKGSFLEMENSPDMGVTVMIALGDVGIINEFNVERQIGEKVSSQRERAIMRERFLAWRAEFGRREGAPDFVSRLLRQLAGDIRPGEAPRRGEADREPPALAGAGRLGAEKPMYFSFRESQGFDAIGGLAAGPGGNRDLYNRTRMTDMGIESGLPPFSGSRFIAQLDRLRDMGYTGLAYYLRHDGAVGPAVGDVVDYVGEHHAHPRRMRWLSAVVNSSPHGGTLQEALGGPQ